MADTGWQLDSQEGIKPDVAINQPEIFDTHPIQVEKPLTVDMNNEQVKMLKKFWTDWALSRGGKMVILVRKQK